MSSEIEMQVSLTEASHLTTTQDKFNNCTMFCSGCKLVIRDRFFLKAADKMWHINCLRCWICHIELHSEMTCYTREGVVYCKEDYGRLFGRKCCIRCGIKITYDELVMRVKDLVFHVSCFCCVQCGRMLNPGEYFGLKGLLPFCQDDLIKNPMNINDEFLYNLQNGINPPGTVPHPFLFHPLSRLNHFYPSPHESHNFHSIIPKVRGKKKRKGNDIDNIYDANEDYCMGNPSRQKRMRTSFKHHQLRAMKSYFSLNHNPDAKDLKSLSEKTGLSKRVLQVWFQNARAKYRRNVSRTDGTSQGSLKDAKSAAEDSEPGEFSKDGDGNGSSVNNDNDETYIEDEDSDEGDHDDDSQDRHSKIPCLQYLNNNSSPEVSELSYCSTTGQDHNTLFDAVESSGKNIQSMVNDITKNNGRGMIVSSALYTNL